VTTYHVTAEWDDDARVWVASSEDVPGLATGADTFEDLVEKLKDRHTRAPCRERLLPVGTDSVPLRSKPSVTNSRPSPDGRQLTPRVKTLLRAKGCTFVRHGKGPRDLAQSRPITDASWSTTI